MKRLRLNIIAVLVFAFVVVLWLYSHEIQERIFPESSTDQFNIVTSLFSALSVAGVIYAILLQRLELELQRNEIKQSTQQLKEQKDALDEQSKTMLLQQFEGTFTSILKSHHEFVSTLVYHLGAESLLGINFFAPLTTQIDTSVGNSQVSTIDETRKTYRKEFLYEAKVILPYFKSLDVVLKYVERSKLSEADKSFYNSIIDAQLSREALRFIQTHIKLYEPDEDVGKEILARLIKFQPTSASLRQ